MELSDAEQGKYDLQCTVVKKNIVYYRAALLHVGSSPRAVRLTLHNYMTIHIAFEKFRQATEFDKNIISLINTVVFTHFPPLPVLLIMQAKRRRH